MKIAILSLYSGHIDRGVETWTKEFATRMSKKHDVLVLQGGNGTIKKSYISKEIKIRILWKLRAGENILSQFISLPYWFSLNLSFTLRSIPTLIRYKPDIVMPTNGGIQTLLVRLLSKIFGWKMVVTGHAGLGAPDKWNILMRPDVFVALSKRGKIWAQGLFISKGVKVVHIPHAVDLKEFSPNIKKKLLKIERPIFLCVSSFDPFKRVELAVKAVARLKKGSLLIIGGDREQGKIDTLAFRFLGKDRYLKIRVKHSEIPSYYSSSDVFTLPSDTCEAFGIVYLEALASGLPIVATDDLLRQEIAGDAGILVDPTDIGKYSKALKKAASTNWGDKPRNQARRFSWGKVINKYDKLFESF